MSRNDDILGAVDMGVAAVVAHPPGPTAGLNKEDKQHNNNGHKMKKVRFRDPTEDKEDQKRTLKRRKEVAPPARGVPPGGAR